ncbi:MAG: hypothetical protein JWN41_836 [Thermoleophilia bacterium]|nr:hypothetical protein [Thermoleophilia bacterium]
MQATDVTTPSMNGHVADEHPLRDASIGELMKQLASDTATLVRQEIELAKAETAEKGRKAGPGLGMFGGAGLLALLATGTFTTVLIAALAEVMPVWLAALIVTVVYGAIAGVLAMQGRDKVKEALPPVPEQTIETVKEDVAWAKTQVQSARK